MSARFFGAHCGTKSLAPHNQKSGHEPPRVTLRRATVRLDGNLVLNAIDWTLMPDEHWAVFGANGSGKTTFLKLIAGLQWPVPGSRNQRIYDFGNGPEEHAVNAQRYIRLIGPELHDGYYRFNWNPTGWALIATGFLGSPILRIRPDALQSQAIRDLVDRLNLGSLIDRRFMAVSRGEQRKLLLARAVINGPRILLLDEICDGLDQSARHAVLEFIDELSMTDVQLVFATHRRHELPQAVNRYAVLRNGGIGEHGTLAALSAVDESNGITSPRPAPADRIISGDSDSTLVAIDNADLYRGDQRVLKAVNWELVTSQNWLVRGANGSGKSTLIKLLHADLRPALGGRITWFGMRSPVNVWALRKRIGLVSDELQSSYGDHVTVYQCVASGFFASIGRVPSLDPQQKCCIDEWLSELGLDALRATNVHKLSYGHFRRVLIARAFVHRPDILLLDEPMSGMDSDYAALIWSLLARLDTEGTRIVMTSHEKEIAAGLFTHELMLAGGRATERQFARA